MTRYVALLRGINVGGKNKLPMKDLRALLEELGCEDVATYIQSGNVVLRHGEAPEKLEARIAEAIRESHGFEPRILLLGADDLEAAAATNPYPDAVSEPKSLHVWFLAADPASPDLGALEEIRKENERFSLEGRFFYLHAPDGIGRSKLAERVERKLGVQATARNWRTVSKLLEMAGAAGS